MDNKLVKVSLIAVSVGMVAGCGGGHGSSSGPPVSSVMNLDSQQVLSQAQKPSETATPYTAADGVVTITDTSEITTPISVNNP